MILFFRTAMHLAAVHGDVIIIDLLREHHAIQSARRPDNDGNTPLHKVYNLI